MEDERNDLPVLASDSIVQVAAEAEKRVAAIMQIKKISLSITNARDWTNQQDRPYLQVSGAEKIANLFNVSWRIDEPRIEFEDDGHFTYTYKGVFSMGGRSIEVEGSRSSKDPFFKKYEWEDGPDGKRIKKEKPISAIDKRDVKMAAMTNLFGNGISRLLGIRNLTWDDLAEFAKIKKDDVQGVEYKKGGEKQPMKEPQKKGNGNPPTETSEAKNPTVRTEILKTKEWPAKKEGGNPSYQVMGHLDGNETSFTTFDKKLFEVVKDEPGSGMQFDLEYINKVVGDKVYHNIISITRADEPGAGENAQ